MYEYKGIAIKQNTANTSKIQNGIGDGEPTRVQDGSDLASEYIHDEALESVFNRLYSEDPRPAVCVLVRLAENGGISEQIPNLLTATLPLLREKRIVELFYFISVVDICPPEPFLLVQPFISDPPENFGPIVCFLEHLVFHFHLVLPNDVLQSLFYLLQNPYSYGVKARIISLVEPFFDQMCLSHAEIVVSISPFLFDLRIGELIATRIVEYIQRAESPDDLCSIYLSLSPYADDMISLYEKDVIQNPVIPLLLSFFTTYENVK